MPPYNKLVFTYIGYEPVEVLVKEQRTVNIAMEEAKATLIDEGSSYWYWYTKENCCDWCCDQCRCCSIENKSLVLLWLMH